MQENPRKSITQKGLLLFKKMLSFNKEKCYVNVWKRKFSLTKQWAQLTGESEIAHLYIQMQMDPTQKTHQIDQSLIRREKSSDLVNAKYSIFILKSFHGISIIVQAYVQQIILHYYQQSSSCQRSSFIPVAFLSKVSH